MERIDYLKVHVYLEKLAEDSFDTPASGSAAATVAAMAAALLEMSYKVALKRGAENIPIDLKKIERVRHQCLAIATEDMKVLAELIQAAKSKKDLPEKYQHALKNATGTLVYLVKNCEFILTKIEQLLPFCRGGAIAELIGGAYMAEAALASVKLGAEVNLRLLQDENYKENVQNVIEKGYQNSIETKERIMSIMNK